MVDDKHDDPTHHDPLMDHDHAETHGDDHGVWHDQPVDDFHDDPATATTSEEHDVPDSEPEAEHDVMAVQKKRNPIIGIAIVAVGVIFLGAIAYTQFGGMLTGSTPAPLPITTTANEMPKMPALDEPGANVAPKSAMLPAAAPAPTPASPTAVAQTGIAMPEKAVTAAPTPAAAIMPSPASQAVNTPSHEAPTPALAVASTPMMPSASPMAPSTSMAPASMQQNVAEPPTAPSPKAMQAIADIQQSDDQRLTALAGRVDDLQKSLETATQKLTEVSLKLSSEPAASPSINPAIDERLSRIEQKISEYGQAAKAPARVEAVKSTPIDNSEPVVPTYAKRKAVHSSYHHARTRHASHTRHHGKTSVATNNWVLRAASADQAWVATSNTSAHLHSIRVGDELPGIGKVRAITEGANGWSVQGSKGTIN